MLSQRSFVPTIFRGLSGAAWPALLACAAVAACSKTAPSADAYVYATVGGGSSTSVCTTFGEVEPYVTIGTGNNASNGEEPTTVPDGTTGVSITCSVVGSGSGYALQLTASSGGGTMIVTGNVDSTGGTVRASFSSSKGTFSSADCALTYTYMGTAVPMNQQLAGGEIFAHIDCPNATLTSGEVVATEDGGTSDVMCDAAADFLFANCSD